MIYYNNIDELPLYNWIKINNSELIYCRKNISIGTEKQDLSHYELIKETNYQEFGVGKDYLALLELYFQLADCNLDFVISGDNFLKNRITMLNIEIDDIIEKGAKGNGDIDETIIGISKWVGYRVDTKITTVKEFNKMISLFKKEIDLRKKPN